MLSGTESNHGLKFITRLAIFNPGLVLIGFPGTGPRARFSKVPIINRLVVVYTQNEGFKSFASNMITLSVNEKRQWSSFLATTSALILSISI